MKIILILPCVLHFPGVVDVVEAADNNLRGSSRDLQLGLFDFGGDGVFGQSDFGSVGDNDLVTLTPTNPNQPSLTFQSPLQPAIPSQTPNNNAPVFGNDIFTFPTNLGFLQPTDQADTPFGFVSEKPFGFYFDGMFSYGGGGRGRGTPGFDGDSTFQSDDQSDDQTDPDTSAGCPTGEGSNLICTLQYDPVDCAGGCRYSNGCAASRAGATGCRSSSVGPLNP
jgi:hypothetical protein